jgi:hypothetical protein
MSGPGKLAKNAFGNYVYNLLLLVPVFSLFMNAAWGRWVPYILVFVWSLYSHKLGPCLVKSSAEAAGICFCLQQNDQYPSCLTRRVRHSCDAGKIGISSDSGYSGSKKCKRSCCLVWRESGVRLSVLSWCVWQERGFSRREDVITFNFLINVL